MYGVTSWLSRSSTRSISSARTPELPLDRQLARSSMVTRATSGGAMGPVPTPMKRRMFRCSWLVLPGEIWRWALSPNPVVTP